MSSIYNISDLEKDVRRAESILGFFTEPGRGQDIKKLIPPSVLAKAHGLMIIRLYRVGLLVSAKGGTGIIIARLPNGSWSAPSGISLTSVGFGHQAGGEVIDSVIVMNYRGAVKAFFDAGGQIQLGAGVSVAAGPLGRTADVSASASSLNHIAATYAYSSSKGLYVGYSFEGSKISERLKANASFYGRRISAREILTGAVPPPQMANELYNMLYSIGAFGPQPGVTFGPTKSINMGSLYQQHHPMASPPMSPQSTVSLGSMYSHQGSYQPPPPQQQQQQQQFMAPTTTANGYPLEKPQQRLLYHHRSSLQPSSSIRNPPQLNPRHSDGDVNQYHNQPPHTRTSDGPSSSAATDFAEPPPPYEPSNTSLPPSPQKQHSQSYQTQTERHRPLINTTTTTTTTPSPVSLSASSIAPIPSSPHLTEIHQKPHSPIPGKNTFVVVAKYDFNGQEQGDLSFKAGDHITVTQWTDDRDSWWHGQLGPKSGTFPANYTHNL